MNLKFKVKEILLKLFNFNGNDDDLIYNEMDSVKYLKYTLTLEKEFDINLDGEDISTINKTVNYLNENYKI
jgi:acyl carrier protein